MSILRRARQLQVNFRNADARQRLPIHAHGTNWQKGDQQRWPCPNKMYIRNPIASKDIFCWNNLTTSQIRTSESYVYEVYNFLTPTLPVNHGMRQILPGVNLTQAGCWDITSKVAGRFSGKVVKWAELSRLPHSATGWTDEKSSWWPDCGKTSRFSKYDRPNRRGRVWEESKGLTCLTPNGQLAVYAKHTGDVRDWQTTLINQIRADIRYAPIHPVRFACA